MRKKLLGHTFSLLHVDQVELNNKWDSLPYEEIAEETGFENLPYFFRIFKKVTCLTPGEYKKRNGLAI